MRFLAFCIICLFSATTRPIFATDWWDTLGTEVSCAIGLNPVDFFSNPAVFLSTDSSLNSYIFFTLHTRETEPDGDVLFVDDDARLNASHFKFDRPTKIITHGYLNSGISEACTLAKEAILKVEDCNVIVVDWWYKQSILLLFVRVPMWYSAAADNVRVVGEFVGDMISFLERRGMNPHTTTLIGHSLGAHVMGIAGAHAKHKVGYIIGLDPAKPCFDDRGPEDRLSKDDAEVVQVIHTDGGHCGMLRPVGQFDFYPNGGSVQPNCWFHNCNHGRAYQLYAESITSEIGFFGRRCPKYGPYDYEKCENVTMKMCPPDSIDRGQLVGDYYGMYYFRTNKNSPYALGPL